MNSYWFLKYAWTFPLYFFLLHIHSQCEIVVGDLCVCWTFHLSKHCVNIKMARVFGEYGFWDLLKHTAYLGGKWIDFDLCRGYNYWIYWNVFSAIFISFVFDFAKSFIRIEGSCSINFWTIVAFVEFFN